MSPAAEVGVVGGGASGFFAAIQAAEAGARVTLLEGSDKCLAKVRISGGGRCNVTHAESSVARFADAYPRGSTLMKQLLRRWAAADTIKWFAGEGVALKTESDGRMFPVTDTSDTIIAALLEACRRLGVRIHMRQRVVDLTASGGRWRVKTREGELLFFDRVILATGGTPQAHNLHWLWEKGVDIVDPVPSLFTFNLPDNPICALSGVSVPQARVWLPGTSYAETGPLLITHWGLSGPAVLRLSARAARHLADSAYQYAVQVNWIYPQTDESVRQQWPALVAEWGRKQAATSNPFALPRRIWEYLLEKAGIDFSKRWAEWSAKERNRLLSLATADPHQAQGKTTFREEFVTAGGIDLKAIHPDTLELKALPGVYACGELLDIDGITGGFNFQCAWTTGYIAGRSAAGLHKG